MEVAWMKWKGVLTRNEMRAAEMKVRKQLTKQSIQYQLTETITL